MAGAQPHALATVIASQPAMPERASPAVCRTLQNYRQTLFWSFAAVLACVLAYVVEKYVVIRLLGWLPNDPLLRMFKNPAELPMRLFGIPHFLIGLAFMLSSRRMRGVKSIAQLLFLTVCGLAICAVFYQWGAHENPLALLLFYAYFLVHGFRDEAFFYKSFGDMPAERARTHERIVLVLQLLLLGSILALIIPAYVLYGAKNPKFAHPALEGLFPATWPYTLRFLSMLGPMTLVATFALWRISREFPDGLAGLWRVHYPILTVFLGSTGIILLALVSGPWSFNVVVLMHFVAWYLFGRHSLRQRQPATTPRGVWPWMRTTVAGFTTLHLGLAALVIILVGVSTYAFGKSGPLEMVVGSKVFYYWTIMHVTLSFFPRA